MMLDFAVNVNALLVIGSILCVRPMVSHTFGGTGRSRPVRFVYSRYSSPNCCNVIFSSPRIRNMKLSALSVANTKGIQLAATRPRLIIHPTIAE